MAPGECITDIIGYPQLHEACETVGAVARARGHLAGRVFWEQRLCCFGGMAEGLAIPGWRGEAEMAKLVLGCGALARTLRENLRCMQLG